MTLSLELRNEIKKRDNYICKYCNCNNRMMLNIDHKVPIHRGGKNNKSNLVTSCFVCNVLKGSMTPKEFKQYLKAMTGLHSLGKFNVNITEIVQHVHLFAGAGSSYNLKKK